LIDRRGPKTIATIPSVGGDLKPARLGPVSGYLCQITDLILLSGIFLGVIILPGMMPGHAGPGALLRAGFSTRNAFVAASCLCTWRVILISVGIYSPTRSRSLADYVFRCLIGLNCCAAVLGLIEFVLRTGVDLWRFLAIYWIAGLVAMAAARAALWWSHQRTSGSRLE